MLTQAARIPSSSKPDFALSPRGNRASTPDYCPIGIPMNFGRNMEIYAEGEPAAHIYRVVSGVIRISKLLPDGRKQISAFHTPGDMFGFEAA